MNSHAPLKVGDHVKNGIVLAIRPDPRFKGWSVILRALYRSGKLQEFACHFWNDAEGYAQSGDYFQDLASAAKRWEIK